MWTKALTNVLFSRHDRCRLCFCEADEDDISFHDEVLLNLKNEKISDMLTYILGGKYTSDMYEDDRFCRTCVLSVKNTYNFIKMCKDKSDSYINIIESLNESLKKTEGVEKTKSVLIHIDSKDYSFMQFYQYREESVKFPGRKKFGNSTSKYSKEKIKKPKIMQLSKHDKVKRKSMRNTESSGSEKATLNNQTNEEDNFHMLDTQDKINLEQQHSNLKAVIKQAANKRTGSRKHILKSNIIKNKVLPSVPQSENQEEEVENPQKRSSYTEIANESYSAKIVNIIRRKRKKESSLGYPCPDCGEKFGTKHFLSVHIQNQTCKHVCKICNIVFPDLFDLRDHKRKEHKDKAYGECDICHIKYNIEGLSCHRKKHFDPKSSLYIPRND